jgi:hypothetical protein
MMLSNRVIKNRGMTLIFVLLVGVVMVMLIASLLMTSQYSLRSRDRCAGLALAEAGIEYARSALQAGGTGDRTSTRAFTTGAVPLKYSNGSNVDFSFVPSPGVLDSPGDLFRTDQAKGCAVVDKDGNVLGYFAYQLAGSTPLHCFAIGALGQDPQKLDRTKTFCVHACLKPFSYSEFTMFLGNPNQITNMYQTDLSNVGYQDPFYYVNPFKPKGGALPADSPIGVDLVPENTTQNFNRLYVAGDVKIRPKLANQEFYGFSLGQYYTPKVTTPTARPSKVQAADYDVQIKDKRALWGVTEKNLGIPNPAGLDREMNPVTGVTTEWKSENISEVERLMTGTHRATEDSQDKNTEGLRDIALGRDKNLAAKTDSGGLYIYGNRSIIGDKASPNYPSAQSQIKEFSGGSTTPADPTPHTYPGDSSYYYHGNDKANNPYLNKFTTAHEDPNNPYFALTSPNDTGVIKTPANIDGSNAYNGADPSTFQWKENVYWKAKTNGTTNGSEDGSKDVNFGDLALATNDPADDYQNNEYVLKFYVGGDGKGYVHIDNICANYGSQARGNAALAGDPENGNWDVVMNGSKCTAVTDTFASPTAQKSLDIKLEDLKTPVIYLKGNARVFGRVRGQVSVVAEGKIAVGRNYAHRADSDDANNGYDLTYSYLSKSKLRSGKTSDLDSAIIDPAHDNDMIGLITPRKIEIDPYWKTGSNEQAKSFAVTAVMMSMGAPQYKYDSSSLSANKFTVNLKEERNNSLNNSYIPYDGVKNKTTFDNMVFWGTQIMFNRNRNWGSYYKPPATTADTEVNKHTIQKYDTRLLRMQPPCIPTLSGGYNIIYWREVSMVSGEDLTFYRIGKY